MQDDLFKEYVKFTLPFIDAYKKKDEHFLEFITKYFPKFLDTLNTHLIQKKTKWLCADHETLADFALGSHIVRLCYNDKYENLHIM